MGFTTALATTAALVPQVLQAHAYNRQARALKSTANLQQSISDQQAADMVDVAAANQQRAAANANATLI